MKTFSGSITKERFLEEIKKHKEADQLLQGTYGEGEMDGEWKGCAVACSLRSIDIIEGRELGEVYSDHYLYETKLGIPEWLAQLEDTIFEGLPKEKAMEWPERFTRAIPVGVTAKKLETVKWKFTAALMQENIERVKLLDISDELKKQVIDALKLAKKLKATSSDDERSAARSARSAAWSAESAARSARSAAWSAESAARSARSAVWSASRSAWSAAYERYADVLIELLEKVK